jgi:hypothetical protein
VIQRINDLENVAKVRALLPLLTLKPHEMAKLAPAH